MKKLTLLICIVLLFTACGKSNKTLTIPEKVNISGTTEKDSSINTLNIDNYLFRDDVVYVDLRPYSWVAKDGHIAGFSFYPYYDFIANNTGNDRLFTTTRTVEGENVYQIGETGTFVANYEESETIINRAFSKEKYIFAISQSGIESIYFLNLLIQLGYDEEKLYNIGGFMISPGFGSTPYIGNKEAKYLVEGNGLLDYSNDTFNAFSDLTPIN